MRTNITQSFAFLEYDDKEWMTGEGNIVQIKDMTLEHCFYSVKRIQKDQKYYDIELKIPRLLLKKYKEFIEIYPEHAL